MIKPVPDFYGYYISDEGKVYCDLGKGYINHINCIRNDNRVENLEWATAYENTSYVFEMGHVVRDKFGRYASAV